MNEVNLKRGMRVLLEWACAIRGDWGSIDGRTCRLQIEDVIALMNAEQDVQLDVFREEAGVCPSGLGHWTSICDSECDPDYDE